MTRHRHDWLPAPRLGWARYYCRCGALGWRNDKGKVELKPHWDGSSDFPLPDVVCSTAGRKPSLEQYDRRLR